MGQANNLNKAIDNKRLVKNTFFLYLRSFITVIISLFTSRIVLQALGIDDYGIYNAVGGVVAMFSIISATVTQAVGRFLNYELGRGNTRKLNTIFCTSIIILSAIGLFIVLIGALLGGWFVNFEMNIPFGSIVAANWVLGCSLVTSFVNLINIPYSAVIIAHEKMSAFAYLSLIESLLKLIIAYLLYVSPVDRLISYAVLMLVSSLMIRVVYIIYCNCKFHECTIHWSFDKDCIKAMLRFTGWTFLTNGVMVLNYQGITILINLFFGVTVNAARGIACQVDSAVNRFVSDFTTAINPQLTKAYALGQFEDMYLLTCRGARFSYYLFLMMALPLIIEAPIIMKIWLGPYPEYTVSLFRLGLIGSMIRLLGNTGEIICMATGKIKRYTILMSIIGFMVFPFTLIAFVFKAPVQSTYIIYIIVFFIVTTTRLWQMKRLTGFPPVLFIKDVYCRICVVTVLSVIFPVFICYLIPDNVIRLVLVILISEIMIMVSIYIAGLKNDERAYIMSELRSILYIK